MNGTRTSSIAVMPKGWRVGRALLKPQRFTDLLPLMNHHCDVLARVLRKLQNDGLARKRGGDGWYELTVTGRQWIQAAMPLLEWSDLNPRDVTPRKPRGNDPVLVDRNAQA